MHDRFNDPSCGHLRSRATDTTKKILEGEKKFLKSREQMAEAHVRITVQSTDYKQPSNTRSYTQELWTTEGNLRLDARHRYRIIPAGNGSGSEWKADESGEWVRDVIIQNCEKPGQMFYGQDVGNTPKFLGPHQWKHSQIANLYYPNLIGVAGGRLASYPKYSLYMYLCGTDRRDLQITQPKLGSQPSCKLVWISSRNVQMSLWLDPTRGFCPIQIEARSEKNLSETEARYSRKTFEDYAPARGNGTLFPRKTHYRQFVGNDVVEEEVVTVDDVEIGVKIDPSVFTVAGAKLGSSFFIIKPELQNSGQWTEDKFVPYPDFTKHRTEALVESPPVPVNVSRDRTWLYYVSLGLIALAAVWFIARVIAKRRSPS